MTLIYGTTFVPRCGHRPFASFRDGRLRWRRGVRELRVTKNREV